MPSYTASKHGVAGLTKLMANEWAGRGLNVNAIAPGYIETNNTQALRADPDRSRAILSASLPAGGAALRTSPRPPCSSAAPRVRLHQRRDPQRVDGGWLARQGLHPYLRHEPAGIVHLGLGAFFCARRAIYVER